MRGSLYRSSLFAAVAFALAGGGSAVLARQPALTSAAPRQVTAGKRSLLGGGIMQASTGYGRKGAGISMAAQQRASRKARNVARSRGRRK